MKPCAKRKLDLVLYLYGELDDLQKAETEAHLEICPRCRSELNTLRLFHKTVPSRPLYCPDESHLKVNRNLLHVKLGRLASAQRQPALAGFVRAPAVRWGFTFCLLLLGFFAGRFSIPSNTDETQNFFNALITADRQINISNTAVDPYWGNVQKLTFDPQNGTVEIVYNTVNDIRLKGQPTDPAVKQILRYAMLEDESPAVRLHAVKAIRSIAQDRRVMDSELLDAIEKLLQNEQNTGIKLVALKVLNTIPLNDRTKKILVRVLLADSDPAIRIQAFEALTRERVTQNDIETYLTAAERDTSSYISYRASDLIDQFKLEKKRGPMELGRER